MEEAAAEPIRIVLVEDHRVVRTALRAVLTSVPGYRVVGEASTGMEASQLVETLRPDVLLLDLHLPAPDGLELLNLVRTLSPSTRVLVLSLHSHESYVSAAIARGAAGFLAKGCAISDLLRGVRAVADGGVFIGPQLSHPACATGT